MRRPPQKIVDYLKKPIVFKIVRNGFGLVVGILFIYLSIYYRTGNIDLSRTAAFVTWLLGHIFLALNLKQDRAPLLKQGFFSNRFGVFWLIGMFGLGVFVTNIPPLFSFLNTTALSLWVWLEILLVSFASTFWLEAVKWVRVQSR